jgi:hypothetical protein
LATRRSAPRWVGIDRMKFIIACFICCIALLQASAADEPLIPAPLNNILLKIQSGMTTNQVLNVLSRA